MYHLRLLKGLSYAGAVAATRENPDVFTEDKAVVDAALASGYFALLAETEPPGQTAHLDEAQLAEMKLEDLKRLAAAMDVDINGLRSKAEFIAAIAAVEVTPGGEDE